MFALLITVLILTGTTLLLTVFLALTFNKQKDALLKFDTQLQIAHQRLEERLRYLENHGHTMLQQVLEKLTESRIQQHQTFADYRAKFDEHHSATLKVLHDVLQKGMIDTRQSVNESLITYATDLGKRFESLTQVTDNRLNEINQKVEKRLTEGFEKTNETFIDIIKRLALIDEAQKRITELSNNVVSLQDILCDKRARGAFGEVQLSALIRNVIPEQHFILQHTLSTGKRVDCMLLLPEPTGNITIDAKFPLENYRTLANSNITETDKKIAEQKFKVDIRKHIQAIAEKYIIAGETAEGAIMFIPAEAIFAEIHARHPDVVEYAQRARVWLASPTTMMAILTTARAVLKDADTRKQLHIIQKHLNLLGIDFERFQKRMDSLTKHIAQAHNDAEQVHISAKKISQRFEQIEKVEMDTLP